MSILSQSFDSLQRSSTLLLALSFPNSAVLPRTVLSSVGEFETTALREVQPHENGLFQANQANFDAFPASIEYEDGTLNTGDDKWTATKRKAPKRADLGREKPSPLKENRVNKGVGTAAQSKDDPGRCLRAAHKLLEVYPLPEQSSHVEALHSQWLGVIDSITDLEETLSQPLARTGPEIQHDESYYRLLSLEDEIKREHLELLALQQFKQDREAELATLKPPAPVPRRPGPAARKVPSVVARSRPTEAAAAAPPSPPIRQAQSKPRRGEDDLAASGPVEPQESSRASTPQPTEPARNNRARPSIPSAVPTPKAIVSKRKSLVAVASAPKIDTTPPPPSTKSAPSRKPPVSENKLPDGVTEEELSAIRKSVWKLMGDVLKPWGKKWAKDQGIERDIDQDGLEYKETITTLESVLSSDFVRDPGSPSSASVTSYATSQANDGNDPSPPSPSTLVEFKLLHILLTTFSTSVPPPSLAPSLPALPIIFRDPAPDSSPSNASLSQTPCLQMNALKAHLGAFAVSRGWTEGMGTTAIYALISKQVTRIDRRGKEGACVGFKL